MTRSASSRRALLRPAVWLLLVVALGLDACTSPRLSRFRHRAAAGDDHWLARQTVACSAATTSCSQLYLIKGSACLRLARAGTAPADHYACSADALTRGLALRPSWPDPAAQRAFQEQLCESLENLGRQRPPDATAAEGPTRFLEAAQQLYQLSPGSVAATYYLAAARLQQIEPRLPEITAADRIPVCHRLKRALTGILTTMHATDGAATPDWHRYADAYQRLAYNLGRAMRTAQCP